MTDPDNIKEEVRAILNPELEDEGESPWSAPSSRLSSIHGLDTSYYRGPFDIKTHQEYSRVVENPSDPIQLTIESITVPFSLFTASLHLLGDSIVEYQGRKRRWDQYRF